MAIRRATLLNPSGGIEGTLDVIFPDDITTPSFDIPYWRVTLPASTGIIARHRQYATPNNSVIVKDAAEIPHLATPASSRAVGPKSWEWWLCGSTVIPTNFPAVNRNVAKINLHNSSYDIGNTGSGGIGWGFGSGVSALLLFYDSTANRFFLLHDPQSGGEWGVVPSVEKGRRYDFCIQLILGRLDQQLGLAGPGVLGGGIGDHPNNGYGRTRVYVDGVLAADTGNINTLHRATNPGDGKTYTQTLLHRSWDGAYVVPSLSTQITMERSVTRVGRTLAEAMSDGVDGFRLHAEWEGGSTTDLPSLNSADFLAPAG